jgi:hypothetical protein
VGYTAWIGAPYFRSVVVRDAAVIADKTPVVKAEAEVDKAKQRLRGLQELMTSLEADPAARARTAMELADARSTRRPQRRSSPA